MSIILKNTMQSSGIHRSDIKDTLKLIHITHLGCKLFWYVNCFPVKSCQHGKRGPLPSKECVLSLFSVMSIYMRMHVRTHNMISNFDSSGSCWYSAEGEHSARAFSKKGPKTNENDHIFEGREAVTGDTSTPRPAHFYMKCIVFHMICLQNFEHEWIKAPI